MMIKWAARIASPIGITAMLLALSACDRIGNPIEAMGGAIPAPDEFQVVNHKPLVLPSAYDLPVPSPGAVSPLAPDPHRDAIQALLGSNASTVVSAAAPGTGERVLLSSANAASASSDIRVQLEQENTDEKANKPYEAPSLFGLLGFTSEDGPDESTLLDPEAEARRLQNAGQATPVDPKAVAEIEEAAAPSDVSEVPTRRPENKLKVEGTNPTY